MMNHKQTTILAVLVAGWLLHTAPMTAYGQDLPVPTATAQEPADTPGADSPPAAPEAVSPKERVANPAPARFSCEMESSLSAAQMEVQRLLGSNTLAGWLTLAVSLVLSLVAGKVLSLVLGWLGQRLQARGQRARRHLFVSLIGPSKLTLITLGLQVGRATLTMCPSLQAFSWKLILLLYSVAAIWYASNLTALVEIVIRRVARRTDSPLDQQVAPLVAKTLQWVLLIFGALYVARSVFGQDIGAWLAGLGIAGLAVSLAAQDSLKNLFGSITILLDRPFRLGDRIVFAGYDGTVEQIGFRSTRLRTPTGHLVSIPNSKIGNDSIENISQRPAIQREVNITVPYDTPRAKLLEAVANLRGILEEPGIREPIHPVINGTPMPPRVFFNAFNADSLNLYVTYWYAPPGGVDYLEHTQRVNFRILEEFEKAEIEFAFPTRLLFLADDRKRRLAK